MTANLTEKEEEQTLNTVEEAQEMIGPDFLKWAHEFTKRLKERNFKDKDIKLYQLVLRMQFDDISEELTFEKIQNSTHIQIFALSQEEIDNMQVKSDAANIEPSEKEAS